MGDARSAMIDAAERLVAEHGLAAMSMREVQAAAGQRNKSAAQYHFGSRDGLVEAIIDERMGPVSDQRLAMLDELDRSGREPTVRELAEAVVQPLALATLEHPDSWYARFLAQAMFDPQLGSLVSGHEQFKSFRLVHKRLVRAFDLPRAVAERRMAACTLLVVTTLASWEGERRTRAATAALADELVDMCVAVLVASPENVPAAPRH